MKRIVAILVIVFAIAAIPAHAQLGGIIGRAVQKEVEKGVKKEVDKQTEKINQTLEAEIEKQVEKQAAKIDSLEQAARETNDALNAEQERLEAEQQAAKDKNAGKKASGNVDTSKYDAINAERKAANAKLTYDRWDY